jgi:hypothetical protein
MNETYRQSCFTRNTHIVLAASVLMSAIYDVLRDVWIPEGALTT